MDANDEEEAADCSMDAADEVRHTLEHKLGLEISKPKSQVVASSSQLLQRVQKRLGPYGGDGGMATNLGIDFHGGNGRGTSLKTRRKRWHVFSKRMQRVRNIRRVPRRAATKIMRTGLNLALLYGV